MLGVTRPRTDLRPLLVEAEDEVRRTRMRRVVPGAALLMVLGLLFLLATPVQPAVGVGGLVLVSIAALSLLAAVLRNRTRELVVRRAQVGGAPATVLRRRKGSFVAGMGVLAVLAAVPLGLGLLVASTEHLALGLVLPLVGVAMAWPVVVALLGRYVPGEVALGRFGVRYRHLGLESTILWDVIAEVAVDEPERALHLRPVHGSSARHRYRAFPRGQRSTPDGAVVLRLHDWGPLATHVGRLVVHYAEHPEDRGELGTPAADARWQALLTRPVYRRRSSWDVGKGQSEQTPDVELDEGGWMPLWRDSHQETTQQWMVESYKTRAQFAGGVLLLALVVLAATQVPRPLAGLSAAALLLAAVPAVLLAFVEPRGLGLAPVAQPGSAILVQGGVRLRRSPVRLRLQATVLLGLGLGAGAALAGFASRMPSVWLVMGAVVVLALLALPVLVLTRRVVAGELRIDESDVAYHCGLHRWSVPWHQVERVDVVRDDILRLGLRDGSAVRADASDMGEWVSDVAQLLERYVEQGGPRGDTRDVETVRRALHG